MYIYIHTRNTSIHRTDRRSILFETQAVNWYKYLLVTLAAATLGNSNNESDHNHVTHIAIHHVCLTARCAASWSATLLYAKLRYVMLQLCWLSRNILA